MSEQPVEQHDVEHHEGVLHLTGEGNPESKEED